MVANRLQAALWREAINLVVNAVVTPEEVDVAIRYGPGIRWALMGIFLTFHLGGGKGGIKYFMKSLEATFENIWNDLASWTEYPENSMATIEERVNEYLKGYDLEKLAEWRDKKIFEILKLIK
jgi:carnitine 3-dehydrogenase